ncbi:putative ribonuclease H-like domain-containing protein [Tanacetum coccineum]
MAKFEFCDKHNMVAYLKKPSRSEGFQEIVDFLNGSNIRYALTKNRTIYVSLIKKFWQTATVRTVDNGEQEIIATVDGKEFTVTEACVRRHLQLADVDGISVLPTTEIFDQLSLIGNVFTDDKLTFQKDKGRALELVTGSSQATIIDFAEVGSSKRAVEAELDHEEAYQFFKDMLKIFDRDDLVMLWNLVKERFNSTEPTDDKERTLWVELKRLFEPNTDDTLWKLQRYMHDPLKWRLYDTCGVHHVSTERGIDIFMLEGSLQLMAMRLLVLISPKWSAIIAIRWDILLGSAELQEIKTTRKHEEGPNYALMAFSSLSSDSKVVKKNDDAPIIKEWVSDDEEEDVSQLKTKKKIVRPSIVKKEFVKSKQQEKTARKTVKQVEQHRQNTHSPRGNQRNWNNMMSQKLGSNFEMFNKACYVCGSFDHLQGNPQIDLQDKGVIDSGCSRHMTGNMSYLTDYEEIDGGYIAFGGNPKGGKITRKCTIKTNNLDFENVYFVRELKFNLFSVSQICDKKNSVLFNDTECIVLSLNFKLIDESQVLLRVPRKNNMYSVDLKNIVPKGGLTCLFAKATSDESKLWHRRLGHLNFKTMNKLVKGNLVRGLPSKLFENDQTCVACQKGKQHRTSCKSKIENLISLSLHLLHMDLFGPTFIKSLMKKIYCLVVTYDYSRFTWVFFLATKDETSGILKSFITGIENLVDHKVKVIRCDNGTEFKNREMNQFYEMKGILRQFSVARNPQQNGVIKGGIRH